MIGDLELGRKGNYYLLLHTSPSDLLSRLPASLQYSFLPGAESAKVELVYSRGRFVLTYSVVNRRIIILNFTRAVESRSVLYSKGGGETI